MDVRKDAVEGILSLCMVAPSDLYRSPAAIAFLIVRLHFALPRLVLGAWQVYLIDDGFDGWMAIGFDFSSFSLALQSLQRQAFIFFTLIRLVLVIGQVF